MPAPLPVLPSRSPRTFECANCGNAIEGEPGVISGDGRICRDCFESDYIECADCNAVLRTEDSTTTGHGDNVCSNCLDSHYTICSSCGNEFLHGRVITDSSDSYCRTCFDEGYSRCAECRQIYPTENMIHAHDRSYCEECNETMNEGDDLGQTPPQYRYRNNDRSENEHYLINDAKFAPNPLTMFQLPDENTEMFFGTEIEMIGREHSVNNYKFDLTRHHFWECYDGSVPMGHETISYPMSYNYIMEHNPFKDMCEMAKRAGYKSEDTKRCGLHVHISRSVFGERFVRDTSDESIDFGQHGDWDPGYFSDGIVKGYFGGLRLRKFIYLFEKFWYEVATFSRRKHDFDVFNTAINKIDKWSSRWDTTSYSSDPTTPVEDFDPNPDSNNYKTFLQCMQKISRKRGRYHVVNVTNKKTVEVRIFRGTLNPNVVLACIQLVKFFFDLSNFDPNELEGLTWGQVRRWGIEQYPEFSALCDRRGL